ncbi:MAG: hypothetical protein AAB276_06220 [Pseudomonadota bacterium]
MATEKNPQEYLIKAKLYRFTSILFVIIGFFIFIGLYSKNIDGRLIEALKDPKTIFIFIAPFLPAVLMNFVADKAEKKFHTLSKKVATQK